MTTDQTSEPALAPAFQIVGDRAALFGALAKSRRAFKPIVRSKTVEVRPQNSAAYTFTYAPLESIQDACADALAENGLVLFDAVYSIGSDFELRTILAHESGAYIEAIQVILGMVTARGRDGGEYTRPIKNQELGSEITYRRRYAAGCLLGVSPEDDDDGNKSDGNEAAAVEKRPRTQDRPPSPKPQASRPQPRTQPPPPASAEPPERVQEPWDPEPGVPDAAAVRTADGPRPVLVKMREWLNAGIEQGIVPCGEQEEEDSAGPRYVRAQLQTDNLTTMTVGNARTIIRGLIEAGVKR